MPPPCRVVRDVDELICWKHIRQRTHLPLKKVFVQVCVGGWVDGYLCVGGLVCG